MALVTLAEAKEYLRWDSADEGGTIADLLKASERTVCDVARYTPEMWEIINRAPSGDDSEELISDRAVFKTAILYALGYLFEHRDDADHNDLVKTLRSLLFSVRVMSV